jgi:hypothetical protein
LLQKLLRLLDIRAIAEIQSERLEPARTHAELPHDVIRHEENRAAINAAGERRADGFVRGNSF